MKKLNIILISTLICIFAMVFNTSILAKTKGNPRKGKFLFRKNCLGCHAKNASADGAGKIINPSSKTQAQWQKTFENERYKGVKCIKNWEKLSEGDINDIYLFLYDHAADSPSPVNCADS